MYQLICTLYTETEQGLVLRNNWIKAVLDDNYILKLIENGNYQMILNIQRKVQFQVFCTGK